MTHLKKVIVSAYSTVDRVIEKNGDILRFFNDDSRGFRDSRRNHPVILGDSTARGLWENYPSVIPGRTNIVVSQNLEEWSAQQRVISEKANPHYFASQLNMAPMRVKICRSMEEAFDYAKQIDRDRVFIAGGRTTIDETIDLVDRLEITEIHHSVRGRKQFPEIDTNVWEEVFRQKIYEHSFVTYRRRLISLDKQD